jgi:hypothetical protein
MPADVNPRSVAMPIASAVTLAHVRMTAKQRAVYRLRAENLRRRDVYRDQCKGQRKKCFHDQQVTATAWIIQSFTNATSGELTHFQAAEFHCSTAQTVRLRHGYRRRRVDAIARITTRHPFTSRWFAPPGSRSARSCERERVDPARTEAHCHPRAEASCY